MMHLLSVHAQTTIIPRSALKHVLHTCSLCDCLRSRRMMSDVWVAYLVRYARVQGMFVCIPIPTSVLLLPTLRLAACFVYLFLVGTIRST